MILDDLKKKFKHKTSVDLKDMDLALKGVPILVREVERLEKGLEDSKKKIEHLQDLLKKKRPPLKQSWRNGKTECELRGDEDKNILYIRLKGQIDYRFGKRLSNAIFMMLPNMMPGFSVIEDISELSGLKEKKALFHFRKIIYLLKMMEIGKYIRVASPESKQLGRLFDATFKSEGLATQNADSVENAESILASADDFLKA